MTTRTKTDARQLMVFTGALLEGHFVLTSGRHSGRYINKDTLYSVPHWAARLCKLLVVPFLNEDVQVVAGPTVGGVVLSQWAAYHLNETYQDYADPVKAVFVDEGFDKTRVLKRGYDKLVKGKRVLMVEDVLTTGDSVKKSLQTVEEAGGIIIGVAVLFNRDPENNTTKSMLPQGARLCCLVSEHIDSWPEEECPLCAEGAPISTNAGKGAEYLAREGGK